MVGSRKIVRDAQKLQIETDVLIVGSGGAGLFAAIEAAKQDLDVTLVSKGITGRCGSTMNAYPAIQAPLRHVDKRDSPEIFLKDVVTAGHYLSNQELVMAIAKEATQPILWLDRVGAPFEKLPDGKFKQRDVPRLSTYPRVFYMQSPLCGPPIVLSLMSEIQRLNIKLLEDTMVTNLLTENRSVIGATAFDIRKGTLIVLKAKSTILATGSAAEIYPVSMPPRNNTGDGYAIAYRAGAELVDMEFVKFYVTAIFPESVRGVQSHARFFYEAGAKAVYNKLEDVVDLKFTADHGSPSAILSEVQAGRGSKHGGVYFDLSSIQPDAYKSTGRFETGRFLPRLGIKILELGPSAFGIDGGIKVDGKCKSSLPGLYAAGDVAGGFRGATYLGATGMIFALTSGIIAGKSAAKQAGSMDMPAISEDQVEAEQGRILAFLERKPKNGLRPWKLRRRLQNFMYKHVGLMRNESGLMRAVREIENLKKNDVPRLYVTSNAKTFNTEWFEALEVVNLLDTAELVARAALTRTESRGDHVRGDYPKEDNRNWLKNIMTKMEEGKMILKPVPVALNRLKPED